MFRSLPIADFETADLMLLGKEMVAPPGSRPEESSIPAGYTYLGQFIDHDLTFDPVSTLQRADDPEALVDYRTPRFDLDSVYGRGPDDQPYLYQPDGLRLTIGAPLATQGDPAVPWGYDLPRTIDTELAIIGDPRNDENVIIAQLHSVFMRFHNRMVDELKVTKRLEIGRVQQLVRWHYQWVILYDFLPRVIDPKIYHEVLPQVAVKNGQKNPKNSEAGPPLMPRSNVVQDPPRLRFYKAQREAFIPVEFSGAGYRFGHTLVRQQYRLNMSQNKGVSGPFPILGPDMQDSLRGFGRFQSIWIIDWRLFFEFGDDPKPQRALKINTRLADPLADLPFKFLGPPHSLPQRNLIRGMQLGLPSGQAVAEAMGVEVLDDNQLLVSSVPIKSIGDGVFCGRAPLWCYILAEAQKLHDGERLGPVGSRILMETFVGLMMADGHSVLRQNPLWKPATVEGGRQFGMAEFVRMATELDKPRPAPPGPGEPTFQYPYPDPPSS